MVLNTEWNFSGTFDLIIINLVLEHIQDIEAILKQAFERLNSKGKLFICELHPFKQYLGSKARYETPNGTKELEVFLHHSTDYLNAAFKQGLILVELKEWFDIDGNDQVPRLISFVFKK